MIIDNQLLDTISDHAFNNQRLRSTYCFHNSAQAPAQRMLNALEIGTRVPIHRHQKTQETYILLRGQLRVFFYDASGILQKEFLLNINKGNYGVNIPANQWHSIEVLESNTVIFEVLDGPYNAISPEDILDI